MADGDVVRRLTISANQTGVDETTASMNKLADASNNLATVTDTNAARALSAEAAYNKLTLQIDASAKSQAAIEKGTETLNAALAQGIINQNQYNDSIALLNEKYGDLKGANDNAKSGFSLTGIEVASTANHLRQAAEAAYALSPAFRAVANPVIAGGLGVITTGLETMAGAAVTATNVVGTGFVTAGEAVAAFSPKLLPVGAALSTVGKSMADFAPSIGGTVGAAVGIFGTLLTAALRIAGPILLVVDAFKAMAAITELGSEKMKEFNDIANNAGASGVSTDFFQRQAKGAEDLGLKTDLATTALKNFNNVTQSNLGGSEFDKLLDSLTKAGNFVGNAGVAEYKAATDTASKYSAIVDLITQANDSGQKLAAINLAAKFLPPELLTQLRADGDILKEMKQAADDVKPVDIVTADQIGYAIQLSSRLDAANKTISEGLDPLQKDLTQLGLNYKESWVDIVELEASAVTHLNEMYTWVKGIQGVMTDLGNASFWKKFSDFTGSLGLNSSPESMGLSPVNSAGTGSPANTALAAGLNNPNAVRLAMQQATAVSSAVRGDTSIDPKTVDDSTDAVDRAINALTKQVEAQKAATEAVGQGAAALAVLKARAAETAAVQANDGEETDAQAEKFKALQAAAGATADALAKANVASTISRGAQTAFLSPEDVQIANQLKTIYGDNIPAALNSSEAAALRLNTVFSTINSTIRSGATTFATDFVTALTKGQSIMSALQTAASALGKTLLDAGLKTLVTDGLNSLSGSASSLAGSAGLTAGATTAAATITAAGTAAGAAIAAGATTAATALGIGGTTAGTATATGGTVAGAAVSTGGAVAGTTVGVGGATAGTALAAGGAAAGAALWGPIAALAAAAAGIGLSIFGGSSGPSNTQKLQADQQLQQQVDQQNQAASDRKLLDQQNGQLAGIDQTTLQGQLQAFDISSQQQREQEAKNGNGAIVELEQSLAAQRLAIIQKSNAAIEKTMTDFLTSLKTGSLSILSPQDQLAYEQNLFNTQLAGAQGGNSTDLNVLTTTAQSLLTLAQNFYASGTGYAATYNQVTSAISALAANTNQTTSADTGITNLSDVVANTTAGSGNGVWGANGLAQGTALATASLSGMAEGGIVGNGAFNKDSVVASYAGGGSIALAGGEAITRATSVNANTIGALNYINKTGKNPGNDNSQIASILTQGFNGLAKRIDEQTSALAGRVKSLEDTTRQTNNKRRVPGTKAA